MDTTPAEAEPEPASYDVIVTDLSEDEGQGPVAECVPLPGFLENRA